MMITIMPPMVNEEPVNEFTEMQKALDRTSWIGTGCTKPFVKDEYASFSNEEKK